MPDITPSTLRRIVALRQFPILCEAELAELAMFAENITEVTVPAGTLVASTGHRLDALHLVLNGEIATTEGVRRTWGTNQVFGALEVLANRSAAQTARTTVATTTLQLLAPDVLEILDDSFGVTLAALRSLAAAHLSSSGLPVRTPTLPAPARATPLGLVPRLMLLRQQPVFSKAPLEALVALTHAAEEVRLQAGAIVARAGATAEASYLLIESAPCAIGESGEIRRLDPGDAIGQLEALAGRPHDATIAVLEPARALKVAASSVFDIIEDHTDFGRAILAALAADLLAAA